MKKEKFYISDKSELNDEELRTGRVSYGRIVSRYIDNLVLCNDIVNEDEMVELNVAENPAFYNNEIYQYYVCNIPDYIKELLTEWGFIISYSDKLNVDVLMVDHWGTSWDYVITEVEWSEDYDECK